MGMGLIPMLVCFLANLVPSELNLRHSQQKQGFALSLPIMLRLIEKLLNQPGRLRRVAFGFVEKLASLCQLSSAGCSRNRRTSLSSGS